MRLLKHDYSRMIVVASALAMSVALSGCGVTVPKDTYDLAVVDTVIAKNIRASRLQILVANPDAVKALDGQDIVVRDNVRSLSYLKGAQWSDRLPNLVQARLVQAYENTGQLGGVGRPGDGLAIDYQVLTDIRSFDVIAKSGGSFAHVEIAIRLLNDRNGAIKASRIFSAQSPVNGQDNADYAAALDRAFMATVRDIVAWTLSSIK